MPTRHAAVRHHLTCCRAAGALLHLPVAFIHTQGSVNLVQACSPQTVQKGGLTACTVRATNNSFDDQTVDLDTYLPSNYTVEDADRAQVVDDRHVKKHNVELSGVEPGVPAVAPGASPGYFAARRLRCPDDPDR